MKLGKRLRTLAALVPSTINAADTAAPAYHHLWDVCCDHGHLGLTLFEQQKAPYVHLVDCVPSITDKLQPQCISLANGEQRQLSVHCLDANQLPLAHYQGRHLVIIAGVGGDLAGDLVANICEYNPNTDFDILVCPVRYTPELRGQLASKDFSLRFEHLVEERQRIYEVIGASRSCNQPAKPAVSLCGDQLWQYHCADSRARALTYAQQQLAHYQRKQATGCPDNQRRIAAYHSIADKLAALD